MIQIQKRSYSTRQKFVKKPRFFCRKAVFGEIQTKSADLVKIVTKFNDSKVDFKVSFFRKRPLEGNPVRKIKTRSDLLELLLELAFFAVRIRQCCRLVLSAALSAAHRFDPRHENFLELFFSSIFFHFLSAVGFLSRVQSFFSNKKHWKTERTR